MSLGENLQFLRKKENITQEQLAERLEVSRQSVSKWESDATYPEMDKLIQLCQMFHCSMDDLLQKDISALYVEDKAEYDNHMNTFSKMISAGVFFILFGLSVASLLMGINAGSEIMEEISGIIFFIFIIISVAVFIVAGIWHSDFEKKNLYIENFYHESEIDKFNKKFTVMITSGLVLILIGVLISIGTMGTDAVSSVIQQNMPASYDYEIISGAFFFLLIAIAVTVFVYAGMQKSKYNIEEYNLSHDTESDYYKKNQLKGRINGCLMLLAVIIYLILGFVWNKWGMPSVVVFPVFGIGCGIASIIVESVHKK
ncbi:MAG: helix-turn-helix domain-containing protein [Clostridium sp.]|nr:helix-turn-helix domain-containing protein [Clostridium sp.]